MIHENIQPERHRACYQQHHLYFKYLCFYNNVKILRCPRCSWYVYSEFFGKLIKSLILTVYSVEYRV